MLNHTVFIDLAEFLWWRHWSLAIKMKFTENSVLTGKIRWAQDIFMLFIFTADQKYDEKSYWVEMMEETKVIFYIMNNPKKLMERKKMLFSIIAVYVALQCIHNMYKTKKKTVENHKNNDTSCCLDFLCLCEASGLRRAFGRVKLFYVHILFRA